MRHQNAQLALPSVASAGPVKTQTLLKSLKQAADFYGFRCVTIVSTRCEDKDSQRAQALSRSMPDVMIMVFHENEQHTFWKNGVRL